MKNIRDMSYLELDEFLNQDIYLSENQLTQIRKHKNVDGIRFWGRSKNSISEYTVEINKDNGNGYSSVDIFVKEE
ncbi:MAG: hypothetical protein J6J36_00490 [Clostridia bacterium]|nr:hypothetical protein [Clostridia bacterium]